MVSLKSLKTKIAVSIPSFALPHYIIHNTAYYASKEFAELTRFNIGDFLVVVIYYFDNSKQNARHH